MNSQPTYACIGAISGRFCYEDRIRAITGRGLLIHEGYTELRNDRFLTEGNINTRGKITYFSKKSRMRLMKFMASVKDRFLLFQTFTFPDDVMKGKSISERSRFSHQVRRRFLKRVLRRWPSFKAVIRQEWAGRKSGDIIGESCPHLHVLSLVNFLTRRNHASWAVQLGKLWVDCLGTKEPEKALSVAIDDKSYQWMKSQNIAKCYISKYIAKIEEYEGDESRGRAWYKVGVFNIPDPEWKFLTPLEDVMVRRAVRCYMKRRNSRVVRQLHRQKCNTFVFISKSTIYRILDHVNNRLCRIEPKGNLSPFLKYQEIISKGWI
ncbi:hypothetical protein ES703_59995 [subsurface metagenome]